MAKIKKIKYNLGGNMDRGGNLAQSLNTPKMRIGKSGKNSITDYLADYGSLVLDNIDNTLGLNMYNPTYNTQAGQVGSKVLSASDKLIKTVGSLGKGMIFKEGGLMHINEGGTHEQNALGGVPIGPNALVEEGETINKNFVFSNRLSPNGKKSYAQLSKKIENKYKLRPHDLLSKEAKQMDLDNLALEQETQKQIDNSMVMAKGGKIRCYPDGGKLPTYIMGEMGIPKNKENDIIHQGILDYYDKQAIPTSLFGIYRDRVDELGIDKATEEYRRLVEGQQSLAYGGKMKFGGTFQGPIMQSQNVLNEQNTLLAEGGLMSNFLSEPSKYINPVNNPIKADGGYLHNDFVDTDYQILKSGGTIHIKPENRGKFNATKARTGKTTEELTHSKNPLTRKRAIFAQNARKWKHANGGYMYGNGGGPIDGIPRTEDYYDFGYYQDAFTNPQNEQIENFDDYDTFEANKFTGIKNYPVENFDDLVDYSKAAGTELPMAPLSRNTNTNTIQGVPITEVNSIIPSNLNPEAAKDFQPKVDNVGYLSNLAGNLAKTAMVATSKPPIYNPTLRFRTLNPTAAERLAALETRREIAGAKDMLRRNATNSGQFLTNASLLGTTAANNLGRTVAGIRQGYDEKNAGILNEQDVRNQQIVSGNNLAKEQFRDNRLNQYNKILDSVIGATQQRFAKDVQANNYQNNILDILETTDYKYLNEILDKKGSKLKIVPKD